MIALKNLRIRGKIEDKLTSKVVKHFAPKQWAYQCKISQMDETAIVALIVRKKRPYANDVKCIERRN